MGEERKNYFIASPECMAEAGTVSCMIFTLLSFLFWANTIGILGDGAMIAIAAFQLGAAPMYAYGGMTHIRRGEDFSGIVYILFSVLFGFSAGALNLAGAVAEILGFSYSWAVEGLIFFISGIFLFMLIPYVLSNTFAFVGILASGGLACILYGCVYMGAFPQWADLLSKIGGWSNFVTGLLGLYTVFSTLVGHLGVKIDFLFLSKPVVKSKGGEVNE